MGIYAGVEKERDAKAVREQVERMEDGRAKERRSNHASEVERRDLRHVSRTFTN